MTSTGTIQPSNRRPEKDPPEKKLSENEDILFHWSLLSVDCDSSTELLKEILSLWVTIRGGSIAGCWMEQYKKVSKETSKTALRKGLKRKNTKNELK